MKVHKTVLAVKEYQTTLIPNGAAPVAVEPVFPDKFALYFIGPDELKPEYSTEVGVFVIGTGEPLPEDLRIFPVRNQLINRILEPNARYIGNFNGDQHVFLGNPRPTKSSGLVT